MLRIFSDAYADMKMALEGKKFDMGADKFEIDGLLVGSQSKIIAVVEAKTSLREDGIGQVLCTARNMTKYWDSVSTVLKSSSVDCPHIENCELIHVLVAPYASPEILTSVAARKEKFLVITDPCNNFRIVHDSTMLQGLSAA